MKKVVNVPFDHSLTAPSGPFVLDRRSRASALTQLSAGFMESADGGRGEPWTLPYEEIVYVISGVLTLHMEGAESVVIEPDEFATIEQGTTIIYEATPGTRALYALAPADWLERDPELWEKSQAQQSFDTET